MPGKRRHRKPRPKCVDCNLAFDPLTDKWTTGICPKCSQARAILRRAQTGQRLLARAHLAGQQIRDGREYTILQLPPKRR